MMQMEVEFLMELFEMGSLFRSACAFDKLFHFIQLLHILDRS